MNAFSFLLLNFVFFPLNVDKGWLLPLATRAARKDDGSERNDGKGREEQTACDRPCVDLYQIFYSASGSQRFFRLNIGDVNSHNCRRYSQYLLFLSTSSLQFSFHSVIRKLQDILPKKRCYTVLILVWLFSLGLPFSTFSVNVEEKINTMLWFFFNICNVCFSIIGSLIFVYMYFQISKKTV